MRVVRTIVIGLSIVSVRPATVAAQGFGIYEQSACSMGRGTAGVAEPCDDGSALYVNPARLAAGPALISGGLVLVDGDATFTGDDGNVTHSTSDLGIVPHVYGVWPVNKRLTLAVGAYAPYGLAVRWPQTFSGRFIAYQSDLKTLYMQPTVAYAINDLISVGGGVLWAMSSITLNRHEDLARVPLAPGLTFGSLVNDGTDFVETELASSWAHASGANIGGIVTIPEPWARSMRLRAVRVGVSYLTKVSFEYDGRATFTPVPGDVRVTKANPLGLPVGTPIDPLVAQAQDALQDQDVTTAFDMPSQLAIGASVHPTERLIVLGDYQRVGWSAFDSVTLNFLTGVPAPETLVQNYRDTQALRLGFEYQLQQERPQSQGGVIRGVTLRGGYFANEAAAPDETVTPLLPDAKRNHFTVGASFDVLSRMRDPGARRGPSSALTLDVGYQYVHHADRRGRTDNSAVGEPPTIALNNGLYHSRAHLLALMMVYRP